MTFLLVSGPSESQREHLKFSLWGFTRQRQVSQTRSASAVQLPGPSPGIFPLKCKAQILNAPYGYQIPKIRKQNLHLWSGGEV